MADRSKTRSLKRSGRFFWKLFAGNALLLIGVVGTCVWLIVGAFEDFYSEDLHARLLTHAQIVRHEVGERLTLEHGKELDELAKSVTRGEPGSLRITIIAADGTVLGDSDADPRATENHSGRAEVVEALRNGIGESTRWSTTVLQDMRYLALAVGPKENPLGVVRVALPVKSILESTQAVRSMFQRIAIIALAAAVVLALGLARTWSNRIARVTAAARSISRGDLSAGASEAGGDEVAMLGRALNRMRESLSVQLATIDGQRRTLENLLAQLHEAVIVTDPSGGVALINPAAAVLLGLPQPDGGLGRLSSSTGGGPQMPAELRALMTLEPGAAAGQVPPLRLTVERNGRPLTLLVRASELAAPLFGGEPGSTGRLLVLSDVTELTRTVQIKADFVANASHELRTPLSAIRTAVETLLSMDLSSAGEAGRSMVGVIDRHSERLGDLVNDLLDLSRIEAPAARFEPEALEPRRVLDDLYERYVGRIAQKGLNWVPEIDPDCQAIHANRQLLMLVLDNLVDNAIKFTEEGGRIRAAAQPFGDHVQLTIEDDGCGIPPQEQDRVFERFYQVERSRSGVRRGTGLGLAIVRHAVNAMNGRVELHSRLGKGTRIDVWVPRSGQRLPAGVPAESATGA